MTDHAAPKFFHPLIRDWFADRIGRPTPVQEEAWPRIAAGEHLLVTAPTGSGKTLAAFLWAIDRLATGRWEGGAVRVVYVSPLRALNNDIRRNLIQPLRELRQRFEEAGAPFAPVTVATRSGDTPQSERRRMLRRRPEILITTPETLNILLTSRGGQAILGDVCTVILDEVHAVAGTKRGTHLITAVERLALAGGEFQRLALSATVQPLERVAAWVGGHRLVGDPAARRLEPREVAVIDAAGSKAYDLAIRYRTADALPDPARQEGHPIWNTLADEVRRRVLDHRATLIFANSRRVVERIARLVNAAADRQLVYAHHGSLSREIREVVEERMKAGDLAGIVATSSLELGIDVGAIDQVLLVGTPPSVAATVQRVGRAGHRVGATSRGRLYAVHALDLLDAAAVVSGALEGDIEPLRPPRAPLDVLAQLLLSMTATRSWHLDDLFDAVRAAEPYRRLSRRLFDRTVAMLAGSDAATRLPELKPRLAVDRATGTARARPAVARLLYASGGTIPDRGTFRMRLADSRTPVGELDEEFVWERRVGDIFSLGVQTWRIERITQDDVHVRPSGSAAVQTPFWRFDGRSTPSHLADRRARLAEQLVGGLDEPGLVAHLQRAYRFDSEGAEALVRLLQAQRAATGCAPPHRHHIVVEHLDPLRSGDGRRLTIVHTLWGGQVNRPWALALQAALEERVRGPVEVVADEDCVALDLPEQPRAADLLRWVPPEGIEPLVQRTLGGSGFFGARFRENAGRALLLQRAGFGRRTPLWLSRQRAKELMDAVGDRPDFPITLETYRTCLQDEFDLEVLARLLGEVAAGEIRVSEITSETPSPFAAQIVWRRTNALMYEDDVPGRRGTPAHGDLIEEAVHAGRLRPRIPRSLCEELRAKLQRTAPGYAPPDAGELIEWVKERRLLAPEEWEALLAAVGRDHGLAREELLPAVAERIVALPAPEDPSRALWITHTEHVGPLRGLLVGVHAEPLLSAALDGREAAPGATAAARACAPQDAGGGPGAAWAEQAQEPGLGPDESEENGTASWFEGPSQHTAGIAGVLESYLRYQGPVPVSQVRSRFASARGDLAEALCLLIERGRIVQDVLTEGAQAPEVCDVTNLARLLRLVRARRRPAIEPLPGRLLPLFLAMHQGIVSDPQRVHGNGAAVDPRASGADRLPSVMEPLLGYPAEAALWEQEILPARVAGYRTAWLDALMVESDLRWIGCGPRRITFVLGEEAELIAGEGEGGETTAVPDAPDLPDAPDQLLNELFPDPAARYELDDLLARAGAADSAGLAERLWELAWSGRVATTTMGALRRGLASGFRAARVDGPRAGPRRRMRSSGFNRWRMTRPFGEAWYRLMPVPPASDAMARGELQRERVRLLLDRYGLLFRELLLRELKPLQWSQLFRTLRLMELSGEVIGGHFFTGIPGLQFMQPAAVGRLAHLAGRDPIYWINAADPAAVSGLPVEDVDSVRRVPTTHLVYRGADLVVISQKSARHLEIRPAPDDAHLSDCFGFLDHLLGRDARPRRAVVVERINGEHAAESPYRDVLRARFDVVVDHHRLRVGRRYV